MYFFMLRFAVMRITSRRVVVSHASVPSTGISKMRTKNSMLKQSKILTTLQPCFYAHRRYVFIDTPGQIEVFTWSASGQIITETLASAFPTVSIVYSASTLFDRVKHAYPQPNSRALPCKEGVIVSHGINAALNTLVNIPDVLVDTQTVFCFLLRRRIPCG